MKKLKVLIEVYNGGRYGKPGKYIAIVEPCYFKNGKLMTTKFKHIQTVEVISNGYNYGNATTSERIVEVLEEIP